MGAFPIRRRWHAEVRWGSIGMNIAVLLAEIELRRKASGDVERRGVSAGRGHHVEDDGDGNGEVNPDGGYERHPAPDG